MRVKAFITLTTLLVIGANAWAADKTSSVSGSWSNTDAATRGVVKILIMTDGDNASIQAWGSCQPTPCDWGKTTLDLFGDSVDAKTLSSGLAKWETNFSDTYMTFRREGDELIVETFTSFKDKSGRTNYRSLDHFKLSK